MAYFKRRGHQNIESKSKYLKYPVNSRTIKRQDYIQSPQPWLHRLNNNHLSHNQQPYSHIKKQKKKQNILDFITYCPEHWYMYRKFFSGCSIRSVCSIYIKEEQPKYIIGLRKWCIRTWLPLQFFPLTTHFIHPGHFENRWICFLEAIGYFSYWVFLNHLILHPILLTDFKKKRRTKCASCH